MVIDFKAMEEEIRDEFDDYDDDEQEEILEGIEKLKVMPQEDIDRIIEGLNENIISSGEEDDSVYSYVEKKMWELYEKEYPDEVKRYNEDSDYFDDFMVKFEAYQYDHKKPYVIEAIFGGIIRDNVYDQLCRDATEQLAEEWGLHPRIIVYLNPVGLMP